MSSKDLAPKRIPVNGRVFAISAIGILAISAWATASPESAATALGAVVAFVADNLGWFYIFTATLVVIFMLGIAVSPVGRVKLGPDHSHPQYRVYSWVSMLFAAGIGVDLLFFSVAEPLTQYYTPPEGAGENLQAARQAVVLTLFHYGITGWAMYALMGMAFGYFAYRFNMPLSIRSALYPLIGRRIHGAAGDAVDVAALLGTIFGVATSLGIGVVQLNYGLRLLTGIPENLAVQAALVSIAVITATISAVSGVDKGIKRLSEINVGLALALLFFVVVTGRTSFLMNALIMNVGGYFSSFPSLTMETYAFSNNQEWMSSWTLFFWAWWVAWAPFVGLFLARISRGRTLRQFVAGTLTMPFLFIVLWVSFFGNSALDLVLKGDKALGAAALEAPERAFYLLLEQYPAAPVVMAVASVIGLLLYVTSADSAALVMSNFSSRIADPNTDGPKWSRVFWALATGILTLAMLLVGGIPTLQAATVVMGLPFAIVMYLIMIGLLRALRLETYHHKALETALPYAISERTASPAPSRSWRQRLTWLMSYSTAAQVQQYVDRIARPALEEVIEALLERGANAELRTSKVESSGIDELDLTIAMGDDQQFKYQLYPVECQMPSYAYRHDPKADVYYRLEVFGLTGSLDYDTMGYTKEQLIADVLDRYERHCEYLRLGRGRRGTSVPTKITGETTPPTRWEDDFSPVRVAHPDFLQKFVSRGDRARTIVKKKMRRSRPKKRD